MKRVSIFLAVVFLLAFPMTASAEQSAMDKLYDLAKKEGEVVFRPPVGDAKLFAPFFDAWKKRYPEVKLTLATVADALLNARIISEHSVGKMSIDVSRNQIFTVIPAIERDLLQPYDWTGLVDKEIVHLNNTMLLDGDLPWVFYYNSKLVPEAESPRTWEDLLNPRWKDKICLHRSSTNIILMVNQWGEEKWYDYVKKLATQKPVAGLRAGTVAQKVISGEVVIGNGGVHRVLWEKEKGRPLEIAPISPQGTVTHFYMSFKGAPHPNAAKLFMAWAMTPEAKAAMVATGQGVIKDDPEKLKIMKDKGIEMVQESTVEKAKLAGKLAGEFVKIMGFTPEKEGEKE